MEGNKILVRMRFDFNFMEIKSNWLLSKQVFSCKLSRKYWILWKFSCLLINELIISWFVERDWKKCEIIIHRKRVFIDDYYLFFFLKGIHHRIIFYCVFVTREIPVKLIFLFQMKSESSFSERWIFCVFIVYIHL